MTEKTLLVENPFSFEQNAKKFVQKIEIASQEEKQEDVADIPLEPHDRLYQDSVNQKKFGIIRALDEEAEKIAKAREEHLAREMESKQAWQKQKQKLKLWDLMDHDAKKQQYRIKNILKEKRETIAEFVKKKREIFLSNMNINNKKEETNRLEDFIKNEQESLKARNYYFTNDCQLVKRFMDEVKEAADQAQKQAEEEAKRKEVQKDLISKKNAKIENLDNQISRLQEDFENLKKYKDFIDKVMTDYEELIQEMKQASKKKDQEEQKKQKKKKPEDNMLFMTEVEKQEEHKESQQEGEQPEDKEEIPFSEKQLVEILNDIEQKNLQYIQNMSEAKGELETMKAQMVKEEGILSELKQNDEQKIGELMKQKEIAKQKNTNLKQLRKFNTSKVNISEGEDLDMEEIGDKINEIYKQLQAAEEKQSGIVVNQQNTKQDKEKDKELDSKEMREKMKQIEQGMFKLTEFTNELEMQPDKEKRDQFVKIRNQIKEKKKNQKQQAERQAKEAQIKELIEAKNKKREMNLQNRRKGRPLMVRSLLSKKVSNQQVEKQESEDDDDKYLHEDFDMGADIDKELK